MHLVAEPLTAGGIIEERERLVIRMIGWLQAVLEALEVTQHLVGPRQHPGGAACPPEDLDGLAAELAAFRVVETRARFEGGLEQVVDGLPPRFAAGEVEGQGLVELGEAVGVQLLDHLARAAMQLAALLAEQRLVGHIVRQRVLEHVFQLWRAGLLVDQLYRSELPQGLPRVALQRRHTLDEPGGELPSNDRGDLERCLGALRQPVDAGHDDALDGVGDVRVGEGAGQAVALVHALERAVLHQGLRQFLDVERIALGLPGDELAHLQRNIRLEHTLYHGRRLRLRQGAQSDPRDVRLLAEALCIARPVGEHHHDWVRGHGIEQEPENVLRMGVDPVEILDHQHERVLAAMGQQEVAHGFRGAPLALHGVHRLHRGVARVEREERTEEGHRPRDVVSGLADPTLDLVQHGLDVVAFLDTKKVAQEVEDGEVGDGMTVGDAAAEHPPRAGSLGMVAELQQETRLTNARLAIDEDCLALARLDIGKAALEQGQLGRASDERGEPALALSLQAATHAARTLDAVRPDRESFALDAHLAHGLQDEIGAHDLGDVLAHEDLAGLRKRKQPRRQVRGVPDRGVVHAQVVADLADDHGTGVEPHAHVELDATLGAELVAVGNERALKTEGRVDRAQGMVLVGDGRAEQRHEPVTEELIDGTFVAVDLPEHQFERTVHEDVDVLGIEPFGQRGEAGDVGEKHRDLLTFTFEGGLRGQDLFGKMPGRVRLRRASLDLWANQFTALQAEFRRSRQLGSAL